MNERTVVLIKPGGEPGQGVGYLDDGTMVVVEQGRPHINQEVEFTVTSALQTKADRYQTMLASGTEAGCALRPSARPHDQADSH